MLSNGLSRKETRAPLRVLSAPTGHQTPLTLDQTLVQGTTLAEQGYCAHCQSGSTFVFSKISTTTKSEKLVSTDLQGHTTPLQPPVTQQRSCFIWTLVSLSYWLTKLIPNAYRFINQSFYMYFQEIKMLFFLTTKSLSRL